jgi:hypothetical protein
MSSTNITMRLEDTLIERIDKNAAREGLTRTAYIVSWLPDASADDELERTSGYRITDAGLRHTGRAQGHEPDILGNARR